MWALHACSTIYFYCERVARLSIVSRVSRCWDLLLSGVRAAARVWHRPLVLECGVCKVRTRCAPKAKECAPHLLPRARQRPLDVLLCAPLAVSLCCLPDNTTWVTFAIAPRACSPVPACVAGSRQQARRSASTLPRSGCAALSTSVLDGCPSRSRDHVIATIHQSGRQGARVNPGHRAPAAASGSGQPIRPRTQRLRACS